MKKLLVVLLLLINAGVTVSARELHIVVNHWPPYVDRAAMSKGFAVEIISTALQSKDYSVSWRIEQWERALEGLDVGVYDAVGAVWKNPEREKQMLFSDPYWQNQIKFIKKKTLALQFNKLDDLNSYLIGVVRGYAYQDTFVNSKKLIKIPQNYLIQNLLKLAQGEIDLTLGDEMAVSYQLQQFMKGSIDDFEFLPKTLSTRGLHIAVSKQHPQAKKIIDDFNQALAAMKDDGRFDAIVKKYRFAK
jgi:polar amino acid transport system substrate-binding protein